MMGSRIVRIDAGVLPWMLGAGAHAYRVVDDEQAIPRDAKIVAARMSFDGDDLELRVESQQWPEATEGERLPEIRPLMKMLGVWDKREDSG